MSIRSRYSNDSQLRRPLTNGGSRRNPVPTPLPGQQVQPQQPTPVQVRRAQRQQVEPQEYEPTEACARCPYKRLVEKAMGGNQPAQPLIVVPQNYQPQPQAIYQSPQPVQQQPVQQPIMQQQTQPVQQQPVQQPNEKVGLLTRFRRYVAKNQADMKAAGETTLSEDMAKVGGNWLGGISSGAAKMGQEEIDSLTRKKSKKASVEEDEELLDFLQGKKKPQQQKRK